jgi:hypothetical protein
MRRGELYRYRDPSGVSGTGVVAQVVQFSTGWVAIGWLGEHPAVGVWPDIETALAVHGHSGATEVRWLEPEETGTERVAQVVQFSTGWVAGWFGEYSCVGVWPDIEAARGHLRASEVRWLETTAETSQCHDLTKAAASLGDAWSPGDVWQQSCDPVESRT